MIVSRKFLSHKIWQKLSLVKILGKEAKLLSTSAQTKPEPLNENDDLQKQTDKESSPYANYRFIYPEFLPDPNPIYRNSLREKLERMDMLARRAVLNIPEFYVGSILAVTHSDQHAPGKINKFVGICILREGSGLRTSFILRNVINGESIEINYNLYDPTIQKIDCLRLEKRLDNELLYLRDAPLEYSTFPSDMEADLKPAGFVLLNEMKVPLNSPPWLEKWERKNLKGIKDLVVSRKRQRKAAAVAKPWEKYDLMKTYRETIPEEEQVEIFADVYTELRHLEVQKNLLTRKNILDRQKKDKDKPLV
ncbi:39S ribosomal protein L19, mitochondrial [Habropoda laboriosa]|uniref:Large ribosomal subunit protein bL19m n=1 Tax=Habropoda laboriosa TaxID=597456 RepID=A0A0L7QL46_9HYME|nr:39S ribosomal protein L19, mitochondrial [Habropoda laboriosa]